MPHPTNRKRRTGLVLSVVIGLAMLSGASAQASTIVQNGGFESNYGLGTGFTGTITVANWTVGPPPNPGDTPYVFIADGDANSNGFPIFSSMTKLSGPGNMTSPDGGDFIASSTISYRASISQTILGLTVGDQYQLSMFWAQSQDTLSGGPTTSAWNIGFGSDSVTTGAPTLAYQGFSGWNTYTNTFTATSTSESLTFTPTGSGQGGYALLDGVSLTMQSPPAAVPEPTTYALLCLSLGVVGYARKRMNTKS